MARSSHRPYPRLRRLRILFLAHRVPWPPDKGDKIRAWHFLRGLARCHEVHLGAHIDDPRDAGAAAALSRVCAGLCLRPLTPTAHARRFALALARGRALSLHAFRDRTLGRWVRSRLADGIDLVFAYSAAALEVLPDAAAVPVVADLVDCDSAKWAALADVAADPLRRAVLRREARLVLAAERRILERATLGLVAAAREEEQLRRRGGRLAGRLRVVENGVDTVHYDPELAFPPPCAADSRPLVAFTGAMDYPPNAEAALRFVREVLPLLEARGRPVRFAVVGRDPVPALRRLHDGRRVLVTGRIPDVRPWLAAADLVVAPLAVARGVQNKLLEAMAMARPLVASPAAAAGLRAREGRHLLVAEGPEATAEAVAALLADPARAQRLGRAARRFVVEHYRWEDRLAELAALVAEAAGSSATPAPGATPSSVASISTRAALASQLRSRR